MQILAESTPDKLVKFPADFVWGVATSAFQIEGSNEADGRGESVWDRFCKRPGVIADGSDGSVACDHYHRWPSDIALMRSLNVRSYRFSIAWPRILPEGTGPANAAGLDFYDRLVEGLLAAGIDPHITLNHWDLPQALEDRGGWPVRATAERFVEYAETVAKRLGDRVKHWTTHNEPWIVATLGYRDGIFAPGRKEPEAYLAAVHHLLLSHGMSVPVIRQFAPQAEVGIVLNLTPFYPLRPGTEDEAAARRVDCDSNRLYLDPLFKGMYPAEHAGIQGLSAEIVRPGDLKLISTPFDYLGINYYTRSVVSADPDSNRPIFHHPEGRYTSMDWEIYPQGLYDLLTRLHRDYPTQYYVSENGSSGEEGPDAHGQINDQVRLDYFQSHIAQIHRAIEAGVPLKGYFAWSLLDNFEWAFGYSRRFGLVYTDYTTQERLVKQSGHWYAGLMQNNGY